MPSLRHVKEAYKHELLKIPNVVGVGVGYKIREGRITDEPAIMVYVTRKLPKQALRKEELVPEELDGIKTDVVEVGKIVALGLAEPEITPPRERTRKWRPAPPGVSIGHYAITAGTFGAVVYDNKTGEPLILSNNHVLANENRARIGDPVLQPGPYDGGRLPSDKIGELERYVRIKFPWEEKGCEWLANLANKVARLLGLNCRLKPVYDVDNVVDAAVAKPVSASDITPEILDIGRVMGVGEARLKQKVQKSGRTTALTVGTVIDTDAEVQVWYDQGIAKFVHQIIVLHTNGRFSAGGDSGSLVLDTDNYAVGLLFAGSDKVTVVNPIRQVLEQLDVKIL